MCMHVFMSFAMLAHKCLYEYVYVGIFMHECRCIGMGVHVFMCAVYVAT